MKLCISSFLWNYAFHNFVKWKESWIKAILYVPFCMSVLALDNKFSCAMMSGSLTLID